MKKQVKCLDPDCGKFFFSPVEGVWVGIARDKKEKTKVRLLGGSRKQEDTKFHVEPNEDLEVKKVLVPKEQFCLHCRLKHQREVTLMKNRDKMIAKSRARELGQNENEIPIREIPEGEAKQFDRFTIYRKVQFDYRMKQEAEKREAEIKPNPEAVQAAMKKLEEIKIEREKKDGPSGEETKSQEDSK